MTIERVQAVGGAYLAEIFDTFDVGTFASLPYELAVRVDGSVVILRPYGVPLADGTTHFESAHNIIPPK